MNGKICDTLFIALLRRASRRANEILAIPGASEQIHMLADDGLNQIQRLAQSPLLEDQLTGVALRLASAGRDEGKPLVARMIRHFASPAPRLETEAVRQAVWRDNECHPLPLAQAERESRRLERLSPALFPSGAKQWRSYSALYARMWHDPRTRAPLPTRRLMLAMVTILAAHAGRSAAAFPEEPTPNFSRNKATSSIPFSVQSL